MIVTFISQCEKKAIPRTRRVLDAFADRIGDNTWQTVITEDGLIAVKKLLRKTVTKNTAVSCHWIRGRRRSELLWIVGNRNKFNSEGIVPVNATQKKLHQNKWENDWCYLPLIKALVALSALLHDWGKATVLFQGKLKPNSPNRKIGDPLRHEWISCLLLNALVHSSDNPKSDEAWLNLLIQKEWNEEQLKQVVAKNLDKTRALDNLPPLAQLVAWLIVSHHRLPNLKDETEVKSFSVEPAKSIKDLFEFIEADWGYQNKLDEKEYQKRLKQCFEFEQGLLSQSVEWTKQIKKWSARLMQEQDNIAQVLSDGSWRVVLHHARLCLMMGDHYYSSCDADKTWKTNLSLIANTDHKTKQAKQFLDEHLVRVNDNAMRVAQSLSRLADEMEPAYDIQKLKKKSPQGFEWQDNAVKEIKQFKQKSEDTSAQGWFIVNMASTGKGKTIANAKIMQALSKDGQSLRYVLALGLRTLTLQTGDSYRHDIGLSNDELAVLIGSKAVQELHHNQQHQQKNEHDEFLEEIGSESLEQLLENELDYEAMPQAEFMNILFPPAQAERNKAFLYKPVLACTIDHIMSATETKRGGKYILPSLRLSSSDLVIDEVDDFNGQDLIAIARLVHLTAMLGRKVMISSATIPPALAEGFFNVYQQGWKLYCAFKKLKQTQAMSMWVDEFKAQIHAVDLAVSEQTIKPYKQGHDAFVAVRARSLAEQMIKHKAYMIECADLVAQKEQQQLDESIQRQYFERIRQNIEKLHRHHYSIDIKTGKKVSFGVVRVANISPCVVLTQYLLNADWSEDIAPRTMAYHSRQFLLLRSEQERHLDQVLKRKEKPGEQPISFSNEVIRQHLDSTEAQHVIFILVATPVEEVGRDHDFDWAIVEPSSYRSIIQLAGRVLRHRKLEQNISEPNIGLLQYNLKGLRGAKVAFEKPGFEMNNDKFKLKTKNLSELIDLDEHAGINAIPRIQANTPLKATEKLADLEHAVLAHSLTNYKQAGAKPLNAWLTQYWFLTALGFVAQYNAQMNKPAPKIYRTNNWPSYNQALINRGNLSIWFDPTAQWYAQPQGKQGRNQTYSDTAIQCCLMMKSLFRLSLRMVTGFVQSLIKLCGLNWTAPDYSTLCRRQKYIDIAIRYQKSRHGLHLLVDSTGLKFLGEGEWKRKKHQPEYRRQWRKLHIGIDAETLQIRAVQLTTNNISDSQVLGDLLKQIPEDERIDSIYTDGAYDTKHCRQVVTDRQAHAVIPPRKNAKPWKDSKISSIERNELLQTVKHLGRTIWKKWSGYHRRSLVETKMYCIKLLGDKLSARNFQSQVNEIHARIAVLNKFTELGRPHTQVVT